MKHVFVGLMAIGLASTPMPALAQTQTTASTTINLPVELKDPFQAYSLGLIPFGGTSAAAYVGTNRFSWKTSGKLNDLASLSLLTDAVILFGGGLSTWSASSGGYNAAVLNLGVIATIAALAGSHLFFYAPYWGDKAVDFNYSQVKRNGFKVQTVEQ